MDLSLIIQLLSGAVGGIVAGSLMKNASLGAVLNSIIGILGAGLGGQLLVMLGVGGAEAAGSMDIASIITQVAGGGIGGGVLLAIVVTIKSAIAK